MGKKRINFSVGIAWFGDILNIDAPLVEIGSCSTLCQFGGWLHAVSQREGLRMA